MHFDDDTFSLFARGVGLRMNSNSSNDRLFGLLNSGIYCGEHFSGQLEAAYRSNSRRPNFIPLALPEATLQIVLQGLARSQNVPMQGLE